MLSITFDVGGRLIKPIPESVYDRSEYIKHLVDDIGDKGCNTTDDIVVDIPDKYATVIDNYIKHLNTSCEIIKDVDRLILCFNLATYFVDDNYFQYCVQQLLNNWSYMFTVVYTEFMLDLRYAVFLRCPHDFLPRSFVNNKVFIDEWRKLNQNKVITVNGNETYYNQQVSLSNDGNHRKIVSTYHVIDNKECGHKLTTSYSADGNQIRDDRVCVDGKMQGISRSWYDSGQLETEMRCDNGRYDGPFKTWYSSGNIKCQGTYKSGSHHGLQRYYYNNYQHSLERESNYIDDLPNGVWTWYHDTNTDIAGSETVEPQVQLLGNDNILNEHKLDDKQHHYAIKAQDSYNNNGKKHAMWRWWQNDINHTLDSTGEYDNDKRHGLWIEYGTDGTVLTSSHFVNDVFQS